MKRIALLLVATLTALVALIFTVPAFTAAKSGYVMRSGDAVNAPATQTSCSYGPSDRTMVLACGRDGWPTGSVAVVLTRTRLKVYKMGKGGATGKLLYSLRR
jgi:hypothetical protein